MPRHADQHERDSQIVVLRGEGHSLQAIGDYYRLTRERIRQIVSRYDRDHGTTVGSVR